MWPSLVTFVSAGKILAKVNVLTPSNEKSAFDKSAKHQHLPYALSASHLIKNVYCRLSKRDIYLALRPGLNHYLLPKEMSVPRLEKSVVFLLFDAFELLNLPFDKGLPLRISLVFVFVLFFTPGLFCFNKLTYECLTCVFRVAFIKQNTFSLFL